MAIDPSNPLPSWNEGAPKSRILSFLSQIGTEGPQYVTPAERIAVFDNDGTLWTEYPLQVQIFFALQRVKELAASHPELAQQQPYRALLEGDLATLAAQGKQAVFEIAFRVHAGMTTDQFQELAKAFFATAQHPHLKRLFTKCIYQPQLELLDLLRAQHFKIFIVSGGGVDFMRAFAEAAYGIPPEQVIGSSVKTVLQVQGERSVLQKLPELRSFDDREEKVLNIDLHIGRRPIFAFGNSDGDLAMLRYTGGSRNSLKLLLHHDDSEREFAYDTEFRLSPLREALEVASKEDITLVSMKQDWGTIFSDKRVIFS